MRDILIIVGVLILAFAIGCVLFFYSPSGPAAGMSDAPSTLSASTTPASEGTAAPALPSGAQLAAYGSASAVPFAVLGSGMNAPDVGMVNYRITTSDQLAQLWDMVYGADETPPDVDFSKDEVLAVFDGSHAAGGYSIAVTSITDGDTRTVTVQHGAPAGNCMVAEGGSAPYEIVSVPKTALSITHADNKVTADCP